MTILPEAMKTKVATGSGAYAEEVRIDAYQEYTRIYNSVLAACQKILVASE